MNHTKGKWEAVISHKKDDYIIWAGDEGVFIATTQSVPPAAHETGIYGKQANANLIASAPEMLTFLKEIVHNDKRWRAMNPKNNQGRYDIKLIDKVNYLIRKAEGGK